ncbi:MAG: CRISPR-associated protein Cas4 [Clostridiales bacterium]|nr:CRISPR-associated protein Cas4 [Clostridiales bacterium]
MAEYGEDDFLLLSGIQHFSFCPRQWALIHIEGLWSENFFTASGRVLHAKAHDGDAVEKRGDTVVARSLKIFSNNLGISGECDVVEFHKSADGVPLRNYEGLWLPYPVEYKRGKSKLDDCDRLQLCAQAVCLEEMLCCQISKGALFYGEPRRRETVEFSLELRDKVKDITESMHKLFSQKFTPKAKTDKRCAGCSLIDECVPRLFKNVRADVKKYLEDNIE